MKDKDLNFEKALGDLETTVDRLEKGGLSLNDSLALFEKGVRLARFLRDELDKAEKKVELLLKDEKGGLKAHPFRQEGGEDAEAPGADEDGDAADSADADGGDDEDDADDPEDKNKRGDSASPRKSKGKPRAGSGSAGGGGGGKKSDDGDSLPF